MKLDFYPNEIIEGNFVTLRIEAVGGDLDRVVCKYPRSFMDEMARQLTAEIETALGVKGLADSSVQLVMAFAPNTYLEHICENVTYRRLMLLDKVSAPRDFWIKWTRLAGDITEYSADNIRFELGEDVEQKIREKEYRYLLSSGAEGYHNSMGRKKVTEWREVVKRAAKRGELTKIESDLELSPEIYEIEARIASLLGKKVEPNVETEVDEIPYVHSDESEFESALAKMRQVVEHTEIEEDEPVVDAFELEQDDVLEIEQTDDEVEFEEVEETEDELTVEDIQPAFEESLSLFDAVDEEESEDIEIDEIPEEEIEESEEDFILDDEPADEEEETEEEIPEVEEYGEIKEEIDEIAETEEIEEILLPEEETEEISVVEETPAEEEIPVVEEAPAEEEIHAVEEAPIPTPVADRAAYIRAEIEAKIRLEYESKARIKAEEELIALKCEYQSYKVESEAILLEKQRELETLRLEYHNFLQETKRREMQRRSDEAQRAAEEQALRLQIEAQLRCEAEERERLEETARQALEEKRRLEEQTRLAIEEQHRLEETARLAIEEQHRLEVQNARVILQREEQERLERERMEQEMLRREAEDRAREADRTAELDRALREAEAERARAAMPEMADGRYTYTSKAVKLIFRRSVDPNITTRIHEIIKATVDYYGKDNVSLKIRAMVTDSQTVVLEFTEIPLEEMSLLGNIVKILGNSGLGIAKAIIQ